jgi:predicted nucleic acid-binding protein
VIVADTGAILALIDRSDRHHRVLRTLYETDPTVWMLPWAILPEVDYLVGAHVGGRAQEGGALSKAADRAGGRRRHCHRHSPEGQGDCHARSPAFCGHRDSRQPEAPASRFVMP